MKISKPIINILILNNKYVFNNSNNKNQLLKNGMILSVIKI